MIIIMASHRMSYCSSAQQSLDAYFAFFFWFVTRKVLKNLEKLKENLLMLANSLSMKSPASTS